jgi:hypothetical protein
MMACPLSVRFADTSPHFVREKIGDKLAAAILSPVNRGRGDLRSKSERESKLSR